MAREQIDGIRFSYDDLGGGKFLVRWRQNEVQADGSIQRVQRTRTVHSQAARVAFSLQLVKALKQRGYLEPEAEDPRARPAPTNLEEAARAWLQYKASIRGLAPNTIKSLVGAMKRLFSGLRDLHGLAPSDVVPGDVLDEASIRAIQTEWRQQAKYTDRTAYQTIHATLDMWSWVWETEEFPLPKAPPRRDRVLPRSPPTVAPGIVPTLDECDAVLRRVTNCSRAA